MASTPDYYKTLGVPRDATAKQIKSAFRKLAREHHPDAGGSEAKFKEINEAYEVLSDEKKRELYDQYGTANPNEIPQGWGGNPFGGGDPFGGGATYTYTTSGNPFGGAGGAGVGGIDWADILESLRNGEGAFGTDWGQQGGGRTQYAPQPQPERGEDKTVVLRVSFDEAFHGAEKKIRVKLGGTGDTQEYPIKIPAGAVDGSRIRIKGKGGAGHNGGPAGDLLVKIAIDEHPLYRREKSDVYMDVPVSIAEAALGATVTIPAPDGSKIRVKIPAGTQDGKKLTIKGKGAPKAGKNATGSGNLYLVVKVEVPTQLNEEQKAALEAFEAASAEKVRQW